MSMFPHTVSLYNVTVDIDKTAIKEVTTRNVTLLKGVFLDASKGVNVRTSGLEGADAVTLYIPSDVTALDPETGQKRHYAGPWEYFQAEDKSGLWTLSISGKAGESYFVKGEVVRPDLDREKLEGMVDDVYSVTKVDEKDYGWLPHFEVGGA